MAPRSTSTQQALTAVVVLCFLHTAFSSPPGSLFYYEAEIEPSESLDLVKTSIECISEGEPYRHVDIHLSDVVNVKNEIILYLLPNGRLFSRSIRMPDGRRSEQPVVFGTLSRMNFTSTICADHWDDMTRLPGSSQHGRRFCSAGATNLASIPLSLPPDDDNFLHASRTCHPFLHEVVVHEDVDGCLTLLAHTSVFHQDLQLLPPLGPAVPPPATFRLLSYNIWHFDGNWPQRLPLLAEIIEQGQPIAHIALQEVRYDFFKDWHGSEKNTKPRTFDKQSRLRYPSCSQKDRRAANRFQVEQLRCHPTFAQYTHFVFSPAMSYLQGGFHVDEGLAQFSMLPSYGSSVLELSRDFRDPEDFHQRIIQRMEVHVPGVGAVNVFNTHISLSTIAQMRSAKEIWNYCRSFPLPQVLVGDFNAPPDSLLLQFLTGQVELDGVRGDFVDAWRFLSPEAPEEAGFTFSAHTDLHKRIDFVLVRGLRPAAVKIVGKQKINGELEVSPSDHCGLLVDLAPV